MSTVWDDHLLKEALGVALNELSVDDSTKGALRALLVENLTHGRVQRYLTQNKSATPAAYVQKILNNYLRYNVLMHAIQEGEQEAIEAVLSHLHMAIRRTLLGWGMWLNQDIEDSIHNLAHDTILAVFETPFHYECAPLAWMSGIVKNKCRHLVREAKRQSQLPLIDLDTAEAEEYITALSQAMPTPEEQIERQFDIHQACNELTEKRQMFVYLFFALGYDYATIAQIMEVNENSLYKLKSDTLKHLGKIYR